MSDGRRRRVLRWVLLGVPISGLLAAALGWAWLQRSLPTLAGSLEVAGVTAPVEIVRDREAIPHVFARSAADAQLALGFVHAQDRLWQLELTRRAGSGRLAELFGREALAEDRLMRALGLRRAAERTLAELDAETRSWLDSYAAGVNAGVAASRLLPPELLVLGVELEPWSAVDTLVSMKLIAWQLAVQYGRELLRVALGERLAPAQMSRILGGDPADLGSARAVFGAASPASRSGLAAHSEALGSNAWAVTGERSATGKPLLANDPHLALSMPAAWYLAHLSAPGLEVIGASIPGLPGVIIGRNASVAWGFTNNRADTLDFYLERVDPDDAERYITPGGSARFERLEEVIRIKGADSVTLSVRSTRHGPVISDVDQTAQQLTPTGHVLSVAYAALLPGDSSIRFPHEVARASDVDGVLRAAQSLLSPPQNVIAADTAGGVALIAAGRIPLRAPAQAGRALLPLPGWLAEYDWQGFVPFAELPTVRQPANGVAITANQDLRAPGYRHWLGDDWAAPARAERIADRLAARAKHDAESFSSVQADEHSQRAAELVGAWLRNLRGDGRPALEVSALQRLAAWDFVMRADAAEPLIYARWLTELTRLVYEDELAERFDDVVYEASEQLTENLLDAATPFCDDIRTPAPEACASIAARALEGALAALTLEHGKEVEQWRWGAVHAAHFSHTPLGAVPLIGSLFDTVLPSGGGNDTVNLAEYMPAGAERPFDAQYGPSYRAIYDLAQPEQSSFIVGVGQSGNALSPYYRHFADDWQRGERVPMRTERAVVQVDSIGTLVLRPPPASTP